MLSDFDTFLLWEKTSRDTIDFKRIYVDMTGDLVAGLLLSQIVYWHLPGANGRSKLRVFKNGHYWIAKGKKDWWDEIRITEKQALRTVKILADLNLIIKENHNYGGRYMNHIRLNKQAFLESWNRVLAATAENQNSEAEDEEFSQRDERERSGRAQREHSERDERECSERDERARSLTETTPETISETTPKTTPPTGAPKEQTYEPHNADGGGALFKYICECGIRRKEALKLEQDALKHNYTLEDLQQMWHQAESRPIEYQTGWFYRTVQDGQWKRGRRVIRKRDEPHRKILRVE